MTYIIWSNNYMFLPIRIQSMFIVYLSHSNSCYWWYFCSNILFYLNWHIKVMLLCCDIDYLISYKKMAFILLYKIRLQPFLLIILLLPFLNSWILLKWWSIYYDQKNIRLWSVNFYSFFYYKQININLRQLY